MTKKKNYFIKHLTVFQYALCFIIPLLAYVNTFNHDFALDDYQVILTNKFVQEGVASIPSIWVSPHWYANQGYRPVPASLFAIEHSLFGNQAAPYHVVQVILYAMLCLLLFHFLRSSLIPPLWSFLTVLLFAVHPVHTEVVANIKSADEILCFFFLIASWHFLFKANTDAERVNIKFITISAIAFVLALFSKETALSFICIYPLSLLFFSKLKFRSIVLQWLPYAGIAILFLLVSSHLGFLLNYQTDSIINNSLLATNSVADRLSTALLILGKYLKLLCLPFPLVHDYSYNSIPVVSFKDVHVLISIALIIGLAIAAAVLAIKKSIYSFWIIFFFVTIAIVSNIFYLIGSTMAERFLFIPSLGFCVLLIGILLQIQKKFNLSNKFPIATCMVICSSFAIMTFARNRDWHDNMTLFTQDVKIAKNSASAHASLGNMLIIYAQQCADALRQQGMLELAKTNLKKSLEIDPTYFYAQGNLALAYQFLNNNDSALIHFKKSIELNPQDIISYINTGIIYNKKKLYDSALVYYRSACAMEPTDLSLQIQLATFELRLSHTKQGIEILQNIEQINPDFPQLKELLAIALQMQKRKKI